VEVTDRLSNKIKGNRAPPSPPSGTTEPTGAEEPAAPRDDSKDSIKRFKPSLFRGSFFFFFFLVLERIPHFPSQKLPNFLNQKEVPHQKKKKKEKSSL